jgi:hypothetical protein
MRCLRRCRMRHRCLIPDENDNCVTCGKHIDLPEIDGPMPDLGDIVGICKLIDSTAADFLRAIRSNSRKTLATPMDEILRTLLQAPYKEAKALGYRGTFDRFYTLVCERMPSIKSL